MPQRYKLRLGDGTVLAVDSEGLNTWAHDRRAMAQAIGTQQWRPLQAVLAEEAAAERLARALVRPKPRGSTPTPAKPGPAPAPPEPAPAPEPPFQPPFEPGSLIGAPSEPASPAFAPSFEQPFEPGSLMAPAAEPASSPFELPELGAAASSSPQTPSPFGASSFAPQEFEEPTVPAAPPPTLEAFYEEPASQPYEEPVSQRYFEAAGEPAVKDDLPVIPMKPLEERQEREQFRSAWSEDGSAQDDEDHDDESAGRFDGTTLSVLERVGGFLSRILSPLAPAADRLTARREARGPAARDEPEEADDEVADEPEDEPEDLGPAGPSLFERLSAWAGGLRDRWAQWAEGLRDRFRRPEAGDDDEDDEEVDDRSDEPFDFQPARTTAPARTAAKVRPFSREKVVEVPKPVTELPVVPFKAIPEPRRQAEDVYGGDEPSRFLSILGPAWQWLKFIVTTGALVAAVAYAWVERSQWLPRAADLGQSMFSELDRQVLSRTRHEERQKALSAAGEKLPQLAPQTIELVFARNPMGVEAASEVFQITREAAERGAPSLPPAELEELRVLESELMGGLSRMEQERIREYDLTRARRPIFPFENPHVMDLVARGVRSLPAERRARLQALLHKAVVAGLELPPVPPSDAPTR